MKWLIRSVRVFGLTALLLPTVFACGPAPSASPAAAPTAPPTQGPLPAAAPPAAPAKAASPAAQAPTSVPRSGGTFTDAATSDAVSFHPYLTSDTASSSYQGMVYGGEDAASEIVCYHCRFTDNDVGWTANGYNALNFLFLHVDLNSNRRGMEIGGIRLAKKSGGRSGDYIARPRAPGA